MRTLSGAFFRLVRWPNLVFIALAQFLFYYCVVLPSFSGGGNLQFPNVLQPSKFYLLCLSSLLIAAAGYIINDYFDLHIDRVNKPEKLVVEVVIKRRWAILWHWIFSGLGILIGLYVSLQLHNFIIVLANIGCVILLWFYSTTFKRKLLIGNVIISLLTAWVILVEYFCEFRLDRLLDPVFHQILSRIFKFAVLYGGFAFIISLVREVVKDIEDMAGDTRYGCRTMPIVWGVNVSKVFAATWLAVLVCSLTVIQFYVLQYRWWGSIIYGLLFIIIPLVRIFLKLYSAEQTSQYHQVSRLIKTVMLTGMLSMLFLKIYTSWII